MKFCSKCGKEVNEQAVVCVHCGCSLGKVAEAEVDAPSTAFAILGFFFPLIGLILWAVNKDKTPLKANSAGKGALIGFIVSIVAGVVFGIVYGSLLGSLLYYY